jgi:hypothetical protein
VESRAGIAACRADVALRSGTSNWLVHPPTDSGATVAGRRAEAMPDRMDGAGRGPPG